MLGNSCVSEQLAAFEEGLSSMKLVKVGLSPSGMKREIWMYGKMCCGE
jgi:hypothetical protein